MLSSKIKVLKKREDFVRVAKSGIKSVQKGLIIQAAPFPSQIINNDSHINIRLGFTATKKIGNAVRRNRTKRRLREVANIIMCKNFYENFDFVVIGRYNTADLPFELLLKNFDKAINDIKKQIKDK